MKLKTTEKPYFFFKISIIYVRTYVCNREIWYQDQTKIITRIVLSILMATSDVLWLDCAHKTYYKIYTST